MPDYFFIRMKETLGAKEMIVKLRKKLLKETGLSLNDGQVVASALREALESRKKERCPSDSQKTAPTGSPDGPLTADDSPNQ